MQSIDDRPAKQKLGGKKQEASLVYQSFDSAAEHSGGLSNGEFDSKNALALNQNKHNLHFMMKRRANKSVTKDPLDKERKDFPHSIEIRGVETIEEFFRPEFAQNSQSLYEINDSDADKQDDREASQEGRTFDQADLHDAKSMIRGMGFPNMKHLDPEATGPPVQMTLYKEYEQNENDVKKQRDGFINARANMPNNTFIKLFTNFNEDPK